MRSRFMSCSQEGDEYGRWPQQTTLVGDLTRPLQCRCFLPDRTEVKGRRRRYSALSASPGWIPRARRAGPTAARTPTTAMISVDRRDEDGAQAGQRDTSGRRQKRRPRNDAHHHAESDLYRHPGEDARQHLAARRTQV